MANRPIIYPRLLQRTGNNRFETLGGEAGFSDNHASAPWGAGGMITVIASGLLNPVVTNGVLATGYCFEASAASAAANPPTTRHNPSLHWPFSLRDVLLLMNLTDASGTVGSGGPALSEAAIGGRYAMMRPTSGDYTGVQMVDVDDTSNDLFEVVAKPALVDGVANVAATVNGLVVVRIIPELLLLA